MNFSWPHSVPLVLSEYLWIPEHVSLEGDEFVWEWGNPRMRTQCGDVLGAFTQLAGGKLRQPPDDEVVRFAEDYGPLYGRSRPLGDKESKPWREPLGAWRNVAERVQAAARLARRLRDGEKVRRADLDGFPDPGPFERAFFAHAIETDPAGILDPDGQGGPTRAEFEKYRQRQVRWEDGKAVPVVGDLQKDAKRRIRTCLDELLSSGKAWVGVEWKGDDPPRIALQGLSFPTVIAGQLMCAIYGGTLAVCHGCGTAFTPKRKRPAGRRAFCSKECREEFTKVRKRDERARNR